MKLDNPLLHVSIENFKKVRAVAFDVNTNGLTVIHGKNRQGKTSTLEAIRTCLSGSKPKIDMPVRDGETHSSVVCTFADFVIRQLITKTEGGFKHEMRVTSPDGATQPNAKTFLKGLRASSADPVAFARAKAPEQLRTVFQVMGLDNKLELLEAEASEAYDERTAVGRTLKQQKAHAEALHRKVGLLPEPESSLTPEDALQTLELAQEFNEKRAKIARSYDTKAEYIERMRGEIAELQSRLESAEEDIELTKKELSDYGEERDIEPLQIELDIAITSSRKQAERDALEAQADEAKEEELSQQEAFDVANTRVANARRAIEEMLSTAEFPVDGLGYDTENKWLTYEGLPFSQCSQSETDRLSAEIAMAGDPPLRVLFVKDGSGYDDDSRRRLHEIADKRGFAVIFETVYVGDCTDGVEIVDGSVAP